MREISPAVGISAEDYIKEFVPKEFQPLIAEVRRQKAAGLRPVPSSSLIDRSSVLTAPIRSRLLDEIAKLTDENYVGRSEMCFQFANLLQRALTKLEISSRPVMGNAIYYDRNGTEIYRWQHAWIRVGDEVIDGNVDSIFENPLIPLLPQGLKLAPYWGPVRETPADRKLQEHHGAPLPPDDDVKNIWWPELSVIVDSMTK